MSDNHFNRIVQCFFDRQAESFIPFPSESVSPVFHSTIMSGRVLVYGGRGALGAACVNHFKSQNWVSRLFMH